MIHSAQFVVSKKKYYSDGFKYLFLKNGWILSYHNKLDVYYNDSKDILVLGIVWQTDYKRRIPYEEIDSLVKVSEESILDIEKSWCGRYVIISHGNVYLDTHGLLGVFYSDCAICSSCSILAQLMGMEELLYSTTSEMNYFPGPLTHYDGIRRLLPSQIYNFYDKEIHSRQLLPDGIIEFPNDEERKDYFINVFANSLRNMYKCIAGSKILVALTGGQDSRTLLALLSFVGLDYECFSMEHESITIGDRDIPPKLCNSLSRKFTYVKRIESEYSKELEEEYRLHTSGMACDKDVLFYAYKQYQALADEKRGSVILRSSIWEEVTEYYRKFIGDFFELDSIVGYYGIRENDIEYKSLMKYFDWCNNSKQKGLSDCNRFYWEQRCGCWLSSIEQSLDLIDGISFLQPLNCRWFLSIMLGFEKKKRIMKRHQMEIIQRACPTIASYSFSNNKLASGKEYLVWLKKGKRMIRRLKSMGVKRTIKTYRRIIEVQEDEKRFRT